MTLNQLETLTEDEWAMAWYIVNHITPVPNIEIPPRGLTWFRSGELEKKLIAAFNHVKPEAHPIYSSLLTKLGVQHEIKMTPINPPSSSISSSV